MPSPESTKTLRIGKRTFTVSNLEKVFYPKTGFTKGEVIDYYIRVAPWMLPHLKDRPLTLKRYPDGVDGMSFYEKHCPTHRPDWVKIAAVWSEGNNENINFCLGNDLPTLVWAANIAVLEFHTFLAKSRNVMHPTMIAFDLDPGPPADIVDCCQIAIWVRDLLAKVGLQSFPKTSGSKGLQVYVPLNSAGVTFDDTKPFANAVAKRLEREHPDRTLSNMRKDLRVGKVFIDWSQNDNHKTTVCVYSMRAKEEPQVSTPAMWEEVETALKRREASLLKFAPADVLQRTEKFGDLFEPVLKLKQKMPKASAV